MGTPSTYYGGPGSGGVIRILANTIAGSGQMNARSGTNLLGSRVSTSYGAIRLEALTNTFPVSDTDPLAVRLPGPGPVFNVFNPTSRHHVGRRPNGAGKPAGLFGGVDIVLPVPGSTPVVLATSGVPVGTTVNVTMKPKVGCINGDCVTTPTATLTSTLRNCSNGNCIENVTFNLPAGSSFIEARATFSTP